MFKKMKEMKDKMVAKLYSRSGLSAWELLVAIAMGLFAAGLVIAWMGGSIPDILDELQDKLMDFFN